MRNRFEVLARAAGLRLDTPGETKKNGLYPRNGRLHDGGGSKFNSLNFAGPVLTLLVLAKVLGAAPALAINPGCSSTNVSVCGTAGPWATGATNPGYSYGDGSQSDPSIITGGSYDFSGGSQFFIWNSSGTTTTNVLDNPPTNVNGNGYVGLILGPGAHAPSDYIAPPSSVNLNELVGTFANGSGVIQGTPFAVGAGPTVVSAPSGAKTTVGPAPTAKGVP